ncbi:hypothetical protein ACFSTC_61240 [Nonomuraea ferruginea]
MHPAEDLENLIAHLTRYAVPVRKRLGVERMGGSACGSRPPSPTI